MGPLDDGFHRDADGTLSWAEAGEQHPEMMLAGGLRAPVGETDSRWHSTDGLAK